MTATAGQVAAEIRRRHPEISVKKLHKLLYYCQGHHLAGVGRPLFAEPVSAWDMGPVVGTLWHAEKSGLESSGGSLGEAALNTIGYVLSRYGRLTARDLEHLTHAEAPWQRANATRTPSGSVHIKREWMRDYFAAEQSDDDRSWPDTESRRRFVDGAEDRRRMPADFDSTEGIRARLAKRG